MTRTYSASQESEPNRDRLSESASTERIQFVGVFLEVDLVEHYYVRDGWWAQPRPAKLPQSIPYLDIYLIASVTNRPAQAWQPYTTPPHILYLDIYVHCIYPLRFSSGSINHS
jgi:hypothetical protein